VIIQARSRQRGPETNREFHQKLPTHVSFF